MYTIKARGGPGTQNGRGHNRMKRSGKKGKVGGGGDTNSSIEGQDRKAGGTRDTGDNEGKERGRTQGVDKMDT